jgi:diacylglycerol kinase
MLVKKLNGILQQYKKVQKQLLQNLFCNNCFSLNQFKLINHNQIKLKKMKKIRNSFNYAFQGLRWFLLTDRNGKIHTVCMIAAIVLSIYLRISRIEFCIILLCCALVLSLEMINHAIEQFCNDYHPGYKNAIKTIKDVAAAAVLWASILSAVIAAIIFFPYLIF